MDDFFNHPIAALLDKHPEYRDRYLLAPERALVLSRGCNKNCSFCGAYKGVPEKFKPIQAFYTDLLHQVQWAKELGINKLEYYSTSLDFFQNPQTLTQYLEALAAVQKNEDFVIKVRALACMNSFLHAAKVVPNLQKLLTDAGFWCAGFGVDGIRKEVWQSLGKGHNHLEDIGKVATLTKEWNITMEILMFVGDPKSPKELVGETLAFTTHILDTYPHTVSRIHVAKTLTGSAWWKTMPKETKTAFLCDPTLFYNVDVLACASKVTHPDKEMRRALNRSYLAFIWKERKSGRCVSSTIFPQGGKGVLPIFAKAANRFMPFDR